MDQKYIENLYHMLKLTGGKYVIVEDGEPKAVLMDYKEFEDLMLPTASDKLIDQLSKIEMINKQISRAQMDDLRDEVVVSDDEFSLNTQNSDESDSEDDELVLEPLDQI